jgi:hypothetical protein
MGEHKTCSKCHEAKSRDAFFADATRSDGLSYVCRDCRNARARAKYVKRGPPARRGWQVPTRDGDKKQARRRVNYLVEQGLLPRPEEIGCLDCGDGVFTGTFRHEYDHAHGYDGDNQLRVEPVCSRCHHAREEARVG